MKTEAEEQTYFEECMSYLLMHRVVGEKYIAIQRMIFGQGRLMIGYVTMCDQYEISYCYEDVASAIIALCSWDGESEPQGWFRCPTDGRRRPDGDPSREYIQP